MSQHDDNRSTHIHDQMMCAQATGVLTVRLQVPIDDAAGFLEHVAEELGVEKVDLANVIVKSLVRNLAG